MTGDVPSYDKLLWPTLRAVRLLGGSARIDEMVEKVIELEGLTDEQVAVLHKDGPRSEVEYRIAWARTYLKGMGPQRRSRLAGEGIRAIVSSGVGRLSIQATWCSSSVRDCRTQMSLLPSRCSSPSAARAMLPLLSPART